MLAVGIFTTEGDFYIFQQEKKKNDNSNEIFTHVDAVSMCVQVAKQQSYRCDRGGQLDSLYTSLVPVCLLRCF